MTRIAHLSDLHLLERRLELRSTAARMRLSYLSFGRSLDAEARIERVVQALATFEASGADHLIITGDLTEDGTDPQFELLAEILTAARIDPARVTLTAGNHDAYEDPQAFERALEGPLAPFARNSRAGTLTVLDDLVIVPISTVMAQPFTRSAGVVPNGHLDFAAGVARCLRGVKRAVTIAQHHSPFAHALAPFNWIDGLQNHDAALALVEQHANVHVVHGHNHRRVDRALQDTEPARVFGTTAVVDHAHPLRLYEACDGRLWPVAATGTDPKQPAQLRAETAHRVLGAAADPNVMPSTA